MMAEIGNHADNVVVVLTAFTLVFSFLASSFLGLCFYRLFQIVRKKSSCIFEESILAFGEVQSFWMNAKIGKERLSLRKTRPKPGFVSSGGTSLLN